MSEIFVSYAREDRSRAQLLARALEEEGWSVWWDRSIPAGRTFDEVIEEALAAARCVVVLWSTSSVSNRWVKSEAEEGAVRGVLVPILIESVKIPLAFRSIQAADLMGWKGDGRDPRFSQLLADIVALLGQPARRRSVTRESPTQPQGFENSRAVDERPAPVGRQLAIPRLLLWFQMLAMIGVTIAAFADVESILVGLPLLALTGAILAVLAHRERTRGDPLPRIRTAGIFGSVLGLLCVVLVNAFGWSPERAQEPLPIVILVFAIPYTVRLFTLARRLSGAGSSMT
jgi:hypothetical protein